MSRITTRGRDSWTATNTRRCHQVHIYGELQPMDYPRQCIPPVAWWFVAAVLAPFAASYLGVIA